MKFKLSSNLVRQSLAGHSWMGLTLSALIYVVCLTGVPVVFMHELGRWEQPSFEIEQEFNPNIILSTYEQILSDNPDYKGSISFNLPVQDLPYLVTNTNAGSWLISGDNKLSDKISHPFIDSLINLHVHLHLPRTIGVIIVGILGVLLCSLIFSGIFAHPRIFKDAFTLRWGGGDQIEQTDLHNRLSVWNIPFQLIIGISGAFFGVYNFALIAIAFAHNEGDFQEILGTIYGQGSVVEERIILPNFSQALQELARIAPETSPFQISVENANTEQQYIQISAKHPQRLIYAEEYTFSAEGRYLEKHGFSDGPIGRQILFSIHSLHLGDYGGLGIKLLYSVLGIAMAVVSASGFNIWLQRRRYKDWLNNVWPAIVWATPLAIVNAALLQVIFTLSAMPAFWITLLMSIAYAQWAKDERKIKKNFQFICASALLLLIAGYYFKFKGTAFNPLSLAVNLSLLTTAGLLFMNSFKSKRSIENNLKH